MPVHRNHDLGQPTHHNQSDPYPRPALLDVPRELRLGVHSTPHRVKVASGALYDRRIVAKDLDQLLKGELKGAILGKVEKLAEHLFPDSILKIEINNDLLVQLKVGQRFLYDKNGKRWRGMKMDKPAGIEANTSRFLNEVCIFVVRSASLYL
jgi:hypothetical protein